MPILSIKNKTISRSMLVGNVAYIPPAFESIATITPSGVSTITFSSIPSTYKHLQVRAVAKRNTASTGGSSNLRFNGITTTTYVRHFLRGDGSTATAGGSTGQTSIECFEHTGADASVNDMMGVVILDITDYADTTKLKTIRSISGADMNGTGNIYLTSGLFRSTAAITSLTLFSSANYLNTTFSLYGIKG